MIPATTSSPGDPLHNLAGLFHIKHLWPQPLFFPLPRGGDKRGWGWAAELSVPASHSIRKCGRRRQLSKLCWFLRQVTSQE